ncbi:MAG: DUF4190 domain-containing protein [Ruminococcaceae bacterium]|nr:DUF4190 domain-containing protein [Oscillospiraceae bacterium]
MICPNCGNHNEDNATHCFSCGTTLNTMVKTNSNAGKGLAIASLVCGIVSFFCFGIVLGILAVVFGVLAKRQGYRGAMATVGIVLGAIGLALYVIMLIACGSMSVLSSYM